MLKISWEFRQKIKMDSRPQYLLAWKAGVHPVVLSQLITGYVRPRAGDDRVIRVGRLVGLKPEDCFTEEEDDASLVDR